MTIKKIFRICICVVLWLITFAICYGFWNIKADPSDEKILLYFMAPTPILIIWVPYWITTAFIDGYKRTGFFMVILAIADLLLVLNKILNGEGDFGMVFVGMICFASIFLCFMLATVNFIRNLRKS